MAAAAAAAPSAQPARQPEIKQTPEQKIAWLKGWPVLNKAADMDRDSARKLLDDFLQLLFLLMINSGQVKMDNQLFYCKIIELFGTWNFLELILIL